MDVAWPTVNADSAACIRYFDETVTWWDEYLRQVMMANQASVNSSTGKTSNVMMLKGRLCYRCRL